MDSLTAEERNKLLHDDVFLTDYPPHIKDIVDSIDTDADDWGWFSIDFPKNIPVDEKHFSLKGIIANTSFFCIVETFVITRFQNATYVLDYEKCGKININRGECHKLK